MPSPPFERRFTVEAMARAYLNIRRGPPGRRTGALAARAANWQGIASEEFSNVIPLGQRSAT